MTTGPTVGVLALQGGVVEHEATLAGLGARTVRVRRPEDLADLDAVVLPGGESSVVARLLDLVGLREPLREAVATGLPTLGTCAGLVLLAREIVNPAPGQQPLGIMPITVRRNAFGSQTASAETAIPWRWQGEQSVVRAALIRAPEVLEHDPDVEVVAELTEGGARHILGVRHEHVLAVAMHPELTGDTTVHRALLGIIEHR